jgi:hypothetical protein
LSAELAVLCAVLDAVTRCLVDDGCGKDVIEAALVVAADVALAVAVAVGVGPALSPRDGSGVGDATDRPP